MKLTEELARRRTFAIISHPDAGKTTLTEKFLLYGGAIQVAGAVKSNKIKRAATSDFMEIERQRGISVATSVMTFEYNQTLINLLDTPGHKDFAEDTYRTLTAVDSVILVIDSVKGVETQTERLMEVCRMRKTPVIVFINKMDLEGRDPFDLLDELEKKLDIRVQPLSWPVNKGSEFKGVYNLYDKTLQLFQPEKQTIEKDRVEINNLEDQLLDEIVPRDASQLREDAHLLSGVYPDFDVEDYLAANIAPVFFGSARNNFGVKELLDTFIRIAPTPQSRETDKRVVHPEEEAFTGFVFKIHANIDPKHRNRIAFVRIVSGKFERNKYIYHCRLKKELKFSSPATFLASERNIIEEAFPGDVIGLYDTGNFKIGDSLSEGEVLQFRGIPSFSPEIFKELINRDPMKTKQLEKGIEQLTEEGVAQLFYQQHGSKKVVGVVGDLQFEVIQYRLKNEYGASCEFIPKDIHKACWITSGDKKKLDEFIRFKSQNVFNDKDQHLVFLAPSEWLLRVTKEANPDITFHTTSEFKTEGEVGIKN
ncbi:MAG: peptide chain release factor 3 [Chitinophagaceae bacterium]|nr:peptide chain release factor 3 [Chitinophagaceae bacterium]